MEQIVMLNANNPKLLNSADLYGTDRVIFDLKEYVPVEKKSEARILLKEALEFLPYRGIYRIVRVNGGQEGKEDLGTLQGSKAEGYILQVESIKEAVYYKTAFLKQADFYLEISGTESLETAKGLIALEGFSIKGIYSTDPALKEMSFYQYARKADMIWIEAEEVKGYW